jgi:hypothetical protein
VSDPCVESKLDGNLGPETRCVQSGVSIPEAARAQRLWKRARSKPPIQPQCFSSYAKRRLSQSGTEFIFFAPSLAKKKVALPDPPGNHGQWGINYSERNSGEDSRASTFPSLEKPKLVFDSDRRRLMSRTFLISIALLTAALVEPIAAQDVFQTQCKHTGEASPHPLNPTARFCRCERQLRLRRWFT